MWHIAHNHIPTGIRVAALSPDGPHCPWCPTILNSTSHLFATCPTLTQVWMWADNTARLLTKHIPPLPSLITHSHSQNRKRIGRLIQSAATISIWNSYSDRAFLHKDTLSLNNIKKLYISTLLSYRHIDLAQHPKSPWPSISSIISSL
jgi:hypothetical protein